MKKEKNIAFIDGANLYMGILSLGINLDYKKFRIWLNDKFSVSISYIFLGNIPKYSNLYTNLQESGYTIVFKEVIYDGNGKAKGNCDADLVLKAAQGYYENEYDNAIIVSSDGDYASLINFLINKNKLKAIISPANEKKCSILLKRTNAKIYYIDDQKNILKK